MNVFKPETTATEIISPTFSYRPNGHLVMRVVLLLESGEVKVFGDFNDFISVAVWTKEEIKRTIDFVHIFNKPVHIYFAGQDILNVKRMHFYMVQGNFSHVSMDPQDPFNRSRITAEPVFEFHPTTKWR